MRHFAYHPSLYKKVYHYESFMLLADDHRDNPPPVSLFGTVHDFVSFLNKLITGTGHRYGRRSKRRPLCGYVILFIDLFSLQPGLADTDIDLERWVERPG